MIFFRLVKISTAEKKSPKLFIYQATEILNLILANRTTHKSLHRWILDTEVALFIAPLRSFLSMDFYDNMIDQYCINSIINHHQKKTCPYPYHLPTFFRVFFEKTQGPQTPETPTTDLPTSIHPTIPLPSIAVRHWHRLEPWMHRFIHHRGHTHRWHWHWNHITTSPVVVSRSVGPFVF